MANRGLPIEFVDYIVAEDAETMMENITTFERAFKSAVADADILDPAATVHNQVQLLPGSVRCVAHLELPCAAGGLIGLLQHIAACSGNDPGV